MGELILKFMALSYIPTILIAVSDTLIRMDNGEKFWWDDLTDWITNKINNYDDRRNKGESSDKSAE